MEWRRGASGSVYIRAMKDSHCQHEVQEKELDQPRLFSNMANLLFLAATASAAAIFGRDSPSVDPLAACPGYKAHNISTTATSLTAQLSLAGTACDVYGTDLTDLTLEVSYDTGELGPGDPGFSLPGSANPLTRNSPTRQNPRCR